MALHSLMVPLGTPRPRVTVEDANGVPVELTGTPGCPQLVMFVCNHCPYVRHVEHEIAAIAKEFDDQIYIVAITANDLDNYPQDGPAGMQEQIARTGWDFPYYLDRSQDAAKAFGAACTPDFFMYDGEGRLAYRGALDESTPKNDAIVDGHLLRAAITRVIAGAAVPEPHRPAMGCGIKWRPGNEPPAVSFG